MSVQAGLIEKFTAVEPQAHKLCGKNEIFSTKSAAYAGPILQERS